VFAWPAGNTNLAKNRLLKTGCFRAKAVTAASVAPSTRFLMLDLQQFTSTDINDTYFHGSSNLVFSAKALRLAVKKRTP